MPEAKKTAFVHKLYAMLEDPALSNLMWWTAGDDGRFALVPGTEFAHTLKSYFKHGNVASFVRQLHMYGFHKVSDVNKSSHASNSHNTGSEAVWEFRHSQGYFRKGDIESLANIKRRTSSHSSTSQTHHFAQQALPLQTQTPLGSLNSFNYGQLFAMNSGYVPIPPQQQPQQFYQPYNLSLQSYIPLQQQSIYGLATKEDQIGMMENSTRDLYYTNQQIRSKSDDMTRDLQNANKDLIHFTENNARYSSIASTSSLPPLSSIKTSISNGDSFQQQSFSSFNKPMISPNSTTLGSSISTTLPMSSRSYAETGNGLNGSYMLPQNSPLKATTQSDYYESIRYRTQMTSNMNDGIESRPTYSSVPSSGYLYQTNSSGTMAGGVGTTDTQLSASFNPSRSKPRNPSVLFDPLSRAPITPTSDNITNSYSSLLATSPQGKDSMNSFPKSHSVPSISPVKSSRDTSLISGRNHSYDLGYSSLAEQKASRVLQSLSGSNSTTSTYQQEAYTQSSGFGRRSGNLNKYFSPTTSSNLASTPISHPYHPSSPSQRITSDAEQDSYITRNGTPALSYNGNMNGNMNGNVNKSDQGMINNLPTSPTKNLNSKNSVSSITSVRTSQGSLSSISSYVSGQGSISSLSTYPSYTTSVPPIENAALNKIEECSNESDSKDGESPIATSNSSSIMNSGNIRQGIPTVSSSSSLVSILNPTPGNKTERGNSCHKRGRSCSFDNESETESKTESLLKKLKVSEITNK